MSGTFSQGLRMNALPSVTAIGNIHIGTMAGKLNGVMPATTPSGSRRTSQRTPRADLERAAGVEVLQAERVLDDLDALEHAGARFGHGLAALARRAVRERIEPLEHQRAKAKQRRGALLDRQLAPRGCCCGSGGDDVGHLGGAAVRDVPEQVACIRRVNRNAVSMGRALERAAHEVAPGNRCFG